MENPSILDLVGASEKGEPLYKFKSSDVTLRDLFAGLAMAGDWATTGCQGMDSSADRYYQMADAMLKARENPNTTINSQ